MDDEMDDKGVSSRTKKKQDPAAKMVEGGTTTQVSRVNRTDPSHDGKHKVCECPSRRGVSPK